MAGLLIEDSNNLHFEGGDDLDFAFPAILDPPTGGDQTANVVITGNTSGVVFKAFSIGDGPGKWLSQASEGFYFPIDLYSNSFCLTRLMVRRS